MGWAVDNFAAALVDIAVAVGIAAVGLAAAVAVLLASVREQLRSLQPDRVRPAEDNLEADMHRRLDTADLRIAEDTRPAWERPAERKLGEVHQPEPDNS